MLKLLLVEGIGSARFTIFLYQNKCADALAQKGHDGPFSLSIVDNPYPLLGLLLQDDLRGSDSPIDALI